MDIWIRVIQESQWGDDTWQRGTLPLDSSWTYGWDGERREKKREKKEKKESFRKRSSTFSLSFLAIRPVVSGEARGKVHPRSKSFAPRLESRSFDKF